MVTHSGRHHRSRAELAALKGLIHANDPDSTERRAGTRHVINALGALDSGAVSRAKTAIALHPGSDGQATLLASYRASTGSASTRRQEVTKGRQPITALFAINGAPEPELPQGRTTGEGHRRGCNGRLSEGPYVRAHWKRQTYGPKRSKGDGSWSEGYARGPELEEDQIAVTRLAEGQLQTGGEAGEKRATQVQLNEKITRNAGQ